MHIDSSWLMTGVAVFVIALLSAYAIFLHLKIKKRDKDNARRVEALVAEQTARRKAALQSIEVIARAMQEQQCAISEGCIRLSALLSQVDPENIKREQYSSFFQVAEALSHIPILEQWKTLERKQQDAHLVEIKEVEGKFKDFVDVAVVRLLAESLSLKESLSQKSQGKEPDPVVQHFG